ncbi:LamG domain-containing protein [Sphingomonas sp. MG17]|uniref:LamG domain-containing protein n=1 Tax=Sphingomonas tagetis TaxID=2949092 RepID=A0A9X2HFX3_9SPHN|nr:LamG domain-containing protein [Sphingomonas tagetis]MCP3730381.1 LamG domain-containing protein [Sphingomonas tagetis]
MLDRRTLLIGALAVSSGAAARARPEIWTFDSLTRIGGHRVRTEGAPQLIRTPLGRAVEFDGVGDALFLDHHPLANTPRFTFEALFRPDGGAFEQRWFHLESDETPPVAPGTGRTRMLFEIRVVKDRWYLDAFMRGEGYNQPLIVPDKTFPVGRWYHVAQSYDGTTYRSFVDGALQAEMPLAFKPQHPGKASVGIRMNRVNPFRGAVRQAAFTRGEALDANTFVLKKRLRRSV